VAGKLTGRKAGTCNSTNVGRRGGGQASRKAATATTHDHAPLMSWGQGEGALLAASRQAGRQAGRREGSDSQQLLSRQMGQRPNTILLGDSGSATPLEGHILSHG
jgi:hypothetical protein